MWFPWHKLDVNERIAAPILLREIGVLDALRVGRRIRRRERAGEPFAALPGPADERERLSREQIGPAVLLYQELARVAGSERALAITEEVVVEAAVIFLTRTIGPLRRSDIEGMSEDEKEVFAKERGERFFNATVDWKRIATDRVEFDVVACQFPRLCRELGVPELAPVFCRGDERFFGGIEPDVRLERSQTIAGGASHCPFTIRFAEKGER